MELLQECHLNIKSKLQPGAKERL